MTCTSLGAYRIFEGAYIVHRHIRKLTVEEGTQVPLQHLHQCNTVQDVCLLESDCFYRLHAEDPILSHIKLY